MVKALAVLAGACMLAMMVATTADVVSRSAFNRPLQGAYDVVKLLGGLALFMSLPYTTAIKGHVAVEFFFHKLGRRKRLLVDSCNRALFFLLCLLLSRFCWLYGDALRRSGEVSPTLQLPEYPVAYFAAASFSLMGLIVLHHLFHPTREMIHP